MQHRVIQSIGIVLTLLYALLIVWVYATGPRNLKEIATGAEVAAGTYQVDQALFDDGLALFHREQFRAAREQWQRADPAQNDARVQFYVAYAFYREGWGRLYTDHQLFTEGLAVVNRALSLTNGSTLKIDDPDLQLHTPVELKIELEQGSERSWDDLNPLKLVRTRK